MGPNVQRMHRRFPLAQSLAADRVARASLEQSRRDVEVELGS